MGVILDILQHRYMPVVRGEVLVLYGSETKEAPSRSLTRHGFSTLSETK